MLLEATGGLELPLVAALAAAGTAGGGGQPTPGQGLRQGHRNAGQDRHSGRGVLAHFADAVRPEVRPLQDAATQVLNSLTARRHQVMTMLVSEKNRLGTAIGAVSPRAVSPRIEAHIAWLEQELSDLDKGLRQTLRPSPVWREKDDLLRTVPGVGPQLSLTLLAHLPELGTLDPQADCCPGRRGSLQPRQRHPAGQTRRLGRTLLGAGRPLHGSVGSQAATTLLSGTSTRGNWQLVSRKRWRCSRPCANCWLRSTPCSNMATLGAI